MLFNRAQVFFLHPRAIVVHVEDEFVCNMVIVGPRPLGTMGSRFGEIMTIDLEPKQNTIHAVCSSPNHKGRAQAMTAWKFHSELGMMSWARF